MLIKIKMSLSYFVILKIKSKKKRITIQAKREYKDIKTNNSLLISFIISIDKTINNIDNTKNRKVKHEKKCNMEN